MTRVVYVGAEDGCEVVKTGRRGREKTHKESLERKKRDGQWEIIDNRLTARDNREEGSIRGSRTPPLRVFPHKSGPIDNANLICPDDR